MAAILGDSVILVYMPTSNTAKHDSHEKINSWVSFAFLYVYGALLDGPLSQQSSVINLYKTSLEIYRDRTGTLKTHYNYREQMGSAVFAIAPIFQSSKVASLYF